MTEEINAPNIFFFEGPEICSCVFWEELFPSQFPIMEPDRLFVWLCWCQIIDNMTSAACMSLLRFCASEATPLSQSIL